MEKRTQRELNANKEIYNAIRQIALHKVVNPRTMVTHNTQKTQGFVSKIHLDPDDELYGTIDVQEYNTSLMNGAGSDDDIYVGRHEGVYLSAIQNNEKGIFVIPFLYSDVVIVTDPATLKEYVIEYSHADQVQLDAHSKVVVGVTETKPYTEEDDDIDYDELEPTKNHAHTTYTPTSILLEVGKPESKKPAPEKPGTNPEGGESVPEGETGGGETTPEPQPEQPALFAEEAPTEPQPEPETPTPGENGNDGEKPSPDSQDPKPKPEEKDPNGPSEFKSTIKITADDILSQHDKAQILLDAKQILAKYNAKEIVIKEDGVYLGAGDAKEPAVLGNQLAQLLIDWLTALSQMMTPTMMGPQPPANMAQFVQLQSKVNSFKASISGFLSKTVKVKE